MSSTNVKESLCVRMLRFLNSKQLSGFGSYLECSLFNTNESLVKVYRVLREKAMGSSEEPLSPKKLFEETGVNPDLFAKYASQLVAHLERFIPFWEQNKDPRHGFADAFTAWERMGLDQDLLERQYRKMKRKAEKLPPSEWGFFHAFELEHRYLQYRVGHPRKDQASLFEAAESAFDKLTQVIRIRYYCASRMQGIFVSSKRSENNFHLKDLEYEKLPLLGQAYYQAAVQLEEENLTHQKANEFYLWLKERQHEFSISDREDLFGFLLNICIRNSSKGVEFRELIDHVYMEMVGGKLLNIRNTLPGSHFKNIVSIKIKLGHLADAAQFIDSHFLEMNQEDQKILVPYAKGLIAYHKGHFRESVTQFRNVLDGQPVDIYWGLEARLMLWRSYFEIQDELGTEEYEEFIRQYDALRIYLSRRNHLPASKKISYENFIRIFNRLARMKEDPPTPKELNTLKTEVINLPTIQQRAWLCQIIDRLLDRLK